MRRMIRFTVVVVVLGILLTPLSSNSQSPSQQNEANQLLNKMRELKKKRKQERESSIQKLKAKLEPLMKYSIDELQLALTLKVTAIYGGAKVYADNYEKTYIGTIDDEFATDSIFNDFGTYGSEFSSMSIWNEFGTFGGKFSSHSPFNEFSTTPPFIAKGNRVIGRLTVNKFVMDSVDPSWLKSYFKY